MNSTDTESNLNLNTNDTTNNYTLVSTILIAVNLLIQIGHVAYNKLLTTNMKNDITKILSNLSPEIKTVLDKI